MWKIHPVFPKVPRGFWHRFHRRWGRPLRILEEIISLSESLGADANSPRFETMNEEYWLALRSLHSRTCLHARSVLALLTNGLVDPAWGQWRICHESATIARFIADDPEMAARYLRYTLVNKYQLAKELYEQKHTEAPDISELENLKKLADTVQQELQEAYGHSLSSPFYAWSGLRNFKNIEAKVSKPGAWNPRGEYILAGQRSHSAPNAGEPLEVDGERRVFVVGPKNSGITGPADLVSLSVIEATNALMTKASPSNEDAGKVREMVSKRQFLGAMCWLMDPEIFCRECGGYILGAAPPEIIPKKNRPMPCSCAGDLRSAGSPASPQDIGTADVTEPDLSLPP